MYAFLKTKKLSIQGIEQRGNDGATQQHVDDHQVTLLSEVSSLGIHFDVVFAPCVIGHTDILGDSQSSTFVPPVRV